MQRMMISHEPFDVKNVFSFDVKNFVDSDSHLFGGPQSSLHIENQVFYSLYGENKYFETSHLTTMWNIDRLHFDHTKLDSGVHLEPKTKTSFFLLISMFKCL